MTNKQQRGVFHTAVVLIVGMFSVVCGCATRPQIAAGTYGDQPSTPTASIATARFWDAFSLSFSTRMNDPEGLRAIANQLEAAISPDLKEPYTEFGIQVVGFLRQAAASAMDDNVIEAALNQMSAVSAGRPASFDFKTTQKQTAAFSSTLEKIKTDAILLRNRAIKEDGYDPESRLQFEWWSVRGALKDDYFLVNKNATTWEDATIRIAHVSGVSGKKAKPVTYTFETVEPGQTLKFDSVFISSERINNHIVAFLISIKGKNEPQFNVWRCHSSTGTWTGLAKGHRYYWEHINVPDSKRESIIRTLFPSHEPKPAPK